MTPTISALDLRVVEAVLRMGDGYVLDFNDRSFAAFFEDFGVDIGDRQYTVEGTSKAKRLRRFLRTAEPALSGRVLKALWEHRALVAPDGISDAHRDHYEKIVSRLLGPAPAPMPPESKNDDLDLLGARFSADAFAHLPIEGPLKGALQSRVLEAQRCLRAEAHLSVVILCGSVLEGLCLGIGSNAPARVEKAFTECFGKSPPRLDDWNLFQWLTVLCRLGDLSLTVEKHGHAVRDFRNYVHPGHQMRAAFTPDEHTARIALQVVFAAVADLTRSTARPG